MGGTIQRNRVELKYLLLLTALNSAIASPAIAQTNVTLSGLVDTYVGSLRNSGDPARQSVVNSGGLTTSWFGFKGAEDLGGGLKANFALTGFFRADTGQSGRFQGNETMWSRDAHVGLSGGFGAVSLGRDVAPNFLPTILFNPFGDSFAFSPLIAHADVPLARPRMTSICRTKPCRLARACLWEAERFSRPGRKPGAVWRSERIRSATRPPSDTTMTCPGAPTCMRFT
jgi:hypothetical protein